MIIFGTRGVKSTVKSGDFLCPQCATKVPYKHKKVTNFFTLYFIPLIPLGSAGEYVECLKCKGTFVPRVLEYDPEQQQNEFQAQYETALRHSMIMMMLADGQIDEAEMLIVQKIVNKFGHNDITLDQLEALVEEVQLKNEPIQKYLSNIAPSLNEHGKEVISKCAIAVAGADGHIDDSEIQLINQMALSLQMSTTHLKGIFAEMNSEAHTFSDN